MKAFIKKVGDDISLKVPVQYSKEDGCIVAYCPALDLTTQGDTLKDAEKMFQEAVQIFIEDLIESGTVDDVLSSLGWKRIQKVWEAPKRRFIEEKSEQFSIPCPA